MMALICSIEKLIICFSLILIFFFPITQNFWKKNTKFPKFIYRNISQYSAITKIFFFAKNLKLKNFPNFFFLIFVFFPDYHLFLVLLKEI